MDEAVELCRKPAATPTPVSGNQPTVAAQSPATAEELVSVGANVKVKVV